MLTGTSKKTKFQRRTKIFNVFENPWGLLSVAVIVLLGIWVFRSVAPEKMRWWLWLVPVFIAVMAFGLDWLVETDTEKIENVIYTITKDFEQEKCDAIASLISENYNDSYHRTKKQLVDHCKVRFSEPIIERAIPTIVSIEKSPLNATVIFTVRVLFNKNSDISQLYKQELFVKAQADLEKQADRWLINRIELLEIDRIAASWQGIQQ